MNVYTTIIRWETLLASEPYRHAMSKSCLLAGKHHPPTCTCSGVLGGLYSKEQTNSSFLLTTSSLCNFPFLSTFCSAPSHVSSSATACLSSAIQQATHWDTGRLRVTSRCNQNDYPTRLFTRLLTLSFPQCTTPGRTRRKFLHWMERERHRANNS